MPAPPPENARRVLHDSRLFISRLSFFSLNILRVNAIPEEATAGVSSSAKMQAKQPEACKHGHSPVLPLLPSSLPSVRGGTSGLGGGGCGGGGAGARLFFFCKSICDPRDICKHKGGQRVSVRAAVYVEELARLMGTPRRAGRVPVPSLESLCGQWRQACEDWLCCPGVALWGSRDAQRCPQDR